MTGRQKISDVLFKFHAQMKGYQENYTGEEYQKLRDTAYTEAEEEIVDILVQRLTQERKTK